MITYEEKIRNTIENIKKKKRELSNKIVIPTHHYQRMEIVDIGDYKGDSLKLAKWASLQDAPHIVFCGVRFMVESAAILAKPYQKVLHPNKDAGCPMADMGDIKKVEKAWKEITDIVDKKNIVPVTYINSWIDLKAFTGRNNGTICTSSNAEKMFKWAFSDFEKIFFLPDEYLGKNTAKQMGIPKDKIIVWDPKKHLGGNTKEDILKAEIIVWKGFCHVHTHFSFEDVKKARIRYPKGVIVVHPECKEEVVDASDYSGSTGFIVEYVKKADNKTPIIIGTEINLIKRLARDYPDKKIVELSSSLCPNMYKITPDDLLDTLNNLDSTNKLVVVNDTDKSFAKLALSKML